MKLGEVLTGCVMKHVFDITPLGVEKPPTFFVAKEESGCCARNCMLGSHRPFDMEINNEYDNSASFWYERDYSVPIFCLFRPMLKVFAMQEGRKVAIGTVVDPFALCHFTFDIKDHTGKVIYKIKSNCCQFALLCPGCPGKSCRRVEFIVSDPQGVQVTVGVREG